MRKALILAVLLSALLTYGQSLVELGLEADKNEDYNKAAEYWWQAASMGDELAVKHLSGLYDRVNFSKTPKNGKDIAKKYLQATADIMMKQKQPVIVDYEKNLVIIASEDEILEKTAERVSGYFYGFNSDERCETAIKSLYKNVKLSWKNGSIMVRGLQFKDFGTIPLITYRDADKLYPGYEKLKEWGVYIKHPYRTDRIIPLAKYYDVIELEKFYAFAEVCANLGAQSCEIQLSESSEMTLSAAIKAHAQAELEKFAASINAKAEGKAGIEKTRAKGMIARITFNPPSFIRRKKTKTPYEESSWIALQNIVVDGSSLPKSYGCMITMGENLSISAGITAELNAKFLTNKINADFDFGGNFQKFYEHSFQCKVYF